MVIGNSEHVAAVEKAEVSQIHMMQVRHVNPEAQLMVGMVDEKLVSRDRRLGRCNCHRVLMMVEPIYFFRRKLKKPCQQPFELFQSGASRRYLHLRA